MIRTTLYVHPRPGDAQRVIDLYEERGVVGRAMTTPGCHSIEIGLLAPRRQMVVVTAKWDNRESYDTWLNCKDRAADIEALSPLLSDPPTPAMIVEITGGSVSLTPAGQQMSVEAAQ
ncbi:antibiotic biosynthesis monooxygenase family protein [Microbacterium sp. 13-71-7]|uniref:antibiotic biosynthesis monooxygenase family protein n=1 Tax=Microbacterium sp. 13-71-7 TaxID=1970399 RepID=UPI000BDA0DE9|nr:antibiotic biosynthesis monooxygenase family protein [Microbacterium sp. 13-71-7]OZB85004.1 MAG: hypothetical protein B7X32_05085 [Microbacterium sp. 13-71-7]